MLRVSVPGSAAALLRSRSFNAIRVKNRSYRGMWWTTLALLSTTCATQRSNFDSTYGRLFRKGHLNSNRTLQRNLLKQDEEGPRTAGCRWDSRREVLC